MHINSYICKLLFFRKKVVKHPPLLPLKIICILSAFIPSTVSLHYTISNENHNYISNVTELHTSDVTSLSCPIVRGNHRSVPGRQRMVLEIWGAQSGLQAEEIGGEIKWSRYRHTARWRGLVFYYSRNTEK